MCDAFGRTPLNKNLSFVYCITFLKFVKGIFCAKNAAFSDVKRSFFLQRRMQIYCEFRETKLVTQPEGAA